MLQALRGSKKEGIVFIFGGKMSILLIATSTGVFLTGEIPKADLLWVGEILGEKEGLNEAWLQNTTKEDAICDTTGGIHIIPERENRRQKEIENGQRERTHQHGEMLELAVRKGLVESALWLGGQMKFLDAW